MRNYEQLTKKELIAFIVKIRPKADAYDRVCEHLGIRRGIISLLNHIQEKNGYPKYKRAPKPAGYMTLQEAKTKAAHNNGFSSWKRVLKEGSNEEINAIRDEAQKLQRQANDRFSKLK